MLINDKYQNIYVCMYVNVYIYIYIYVHAYIHICTYIDIYIYIYTHTYICIYMLSKVEGCKLVYANVILRDNNLYTTTNKSLQCLIKLRYIGL